MCIKKQLSLSVVGLSLICFAISAAARNAEVPNTFVAGKEAVAAEVNANFSELESAVNSKLDEESAENRFQELETDIDANSKKLDSVANSKLDEGAAEDRFQTIETDVDQLLSDIDNKIGLVASMAYQKTPTVRGVTISNVKLNDGSIIAPVSPGSSINISLDYHIIDTACPGCIDEIQVGFSHSSPKGCVYLGIPGATGKSGSGSITLTAPNEPGLYYIGVDRAQDFSCPSHWWNGAPATFNRYIAVIAVQ